MLRSINEGKASKSGLLAILLANAGHPGIGCRTSVGNTADFEVHGATEGWVLAVGEETAVLEEDIDSDLIVGVPCPLRSVFD